MSVALRRTQFTSPRSWRIALGSERTAFNTGYEWRAVSSELFRSALKLAENRALLDLPIRSRVAG